MGARWSFSWWPCILFHPLGPHSRRAAPGRPREHRRLAHVVEVEVEEDEALEADARAAVGRHPVAHRVDVRAEAGVDLSGLRDDRGLEHLGDVDALRARADLLAAEEDVVRVRVPAVVGARHRVERPHRRREAVEEVEVGAILLGDELAERALLRGAQVVEAGGVDAPGFDDLSTAQERALGELVAEKYGTDFYFLDRFPSAVRPFYTMPCADDGRYSNSYDIFLRGEEICSGAQRVHVPEMLEAAVVAKTGKVDAGLRPYIDSMRHGMPPHGGAGIGLERLVFLYLNLDNVRKASMFPRTPGRCAP